MGRNLTTAREPRGAAAGWPHSQDAFKKREFLALAPSFSWVNDGHRAASTVLTVSRRS